MKEMIKMKKLSDYNYITNDRDAFIWAWNKVLSKYGYVTVACFKELLFGSEDTISFVDHKVGWTEPLTTGDFIERRHIVGGVGYQLNLSKPKELA